MSCDEMCLNNSVIDFTESSVVQTQAVQYIITPPSKLEFYKTATCIDDNIGTNCQVYMVENIMLGQEVVVDACVLDYYGNPAGTTLFLVTGENLNHRINGPQYVLVSCKVFQRISVIGKKISSMTNFSMTITSHDGSKSDLKTISVQLILKLSPCHPGFHYDNYTQRCICYSDSDIVSCSDSTSFIKRGFWFGKVNDKATVSVCPNNYCNFACCETSNGFYELSPNRANQCNSYRAGMACGNCLKDYTLSFDSIECVSVSKCTTGQTALVVTLSTIYWIVIVGLVFIVTYYHVGIGYLYAIYYYSMVDILLSNTLYTAQGLFTIVSILSSIAKVTPQFLGQLCLSQNLSGIDQEFIHYIHPLAVTIIVVIICLSARISHRISTFVSRGIIHVICFLLLLSYTSVATTSLLLLRSLRFHNVDKVYTYLSPDIEYSHGRHMPYVIIAILCTLVIVIGLPLLLLLEPFLNHKINFIRIKPLLDQFQGCYRDKYRSFAAYYMICRLVIIVTVIANSSNNNTSQYLLVIMNAALVSTHVLLRPYATNKLNVFDFFILQLMIVVSMVPLLESFDPDLLLAFTFVLLMIPLIAFLIMEIYLYRVKIKKITKYCIPPKPDITNNNNEIPMRDFVDSVIDDSSRRNATVCEIKIDEAVDFRESFIGVMNEIDPEDQ
ncbi:putative leucine-rich repeat-containing protein DDB_G0281931 [Dysidea avara]|uniref:putative leucine-rich repeat-containing protein DDB_G0281931 n=1 Tax=Dysidea avara TaxID=196820 RepID=UPI00332FA0E2